MATINAINSNNPIQVAFGGTGVASTTAYAPLCGGTTTTNALQAADSGISTSGYVLGTNGTSALPTFQNLAGSLVLLQTQTVSSVASVSFTSTYITSTYKVYCVVVDKLKPANADDSWALDMSTDNGSTFLSSNYRSGVATFVYNNATQYNKNSTSTCPLTLDNQISQNEGVVGAQMWFYDLAITSGQPSYNGFVTLGTQNNTVMGVNIGSVNVNNIRFKFGKGNTASGSISLYGLKQ